MKPTKEQLDDKIEALSEILGDDTGAWEDWAERNHVESEQLYGGEESEYGRIEDAVFVESDILHLPVAGAHNQTGITGRDVTLWTLTDRTDCVAIVATDTGAIGNDQNCNIWLIDTDDLPTPSEPVNTLHIATYNRTSEIFDTRERPGHEPPLQTAQQKTREILSRLTFPAMIHLTLNTGHSMEVPAGKISPEAYRALRPMVVKKGDLIPGFAPWRTVIAIGEGAASFDIRRNKQDIVVLNAVAWTGQGAAEIWPLIERGHLDLADQMAKAGALSESMAAAPEMPATLPWLATWILPTAVQAVHPRDLAWMADFEQCLAAAIIRKATPNPQPQ